MDRPGAEMPDNVEVRVRGTCAQTGLRQDNNPRLKHILNSLLSFLSAGEMTRGLLQSPFKNVSQEYIHSIACGTPLMR